MEWSTAAASVWGKLEPESVAWVPLVTHLEQTMEVAGLVWDSFVPPAVKQILASDLGGTDEAMRALCCWYAGVHDVGKASVAFAQQAYGRGMDFVLARMQNAGLSVNPVPRSDHVRHETIGQLALRDWLQAALAFTRRRANTWACVVGGHHGCNPNDSTLIAAENRPHVVGVGLWKQVRVEIIEQITAHTGIRDWLEEHGGSELSIQSQVLLTAIVVVSDWLASNQEYFPYLDPLTPHERAQIAFEEIGLPSPWRPVRPSDDPNAFFRARFPDLGAQCIRSSQKALVEAALVARQAPLLIFEAPMGCGKTEAALLASEVVATRFGQGGVYIGLPTMATANPMFDRVLAWLRAALGEADASVSLAHGKAGLNDTYAGLIRDSWRGHVYDEDDAEGGRPIVNSWLRGRRRAGLASFVVGTIDQGLFAALKAKHVALRHLGLAGKVVIVDEVHAADTYMREYLKRALTWLGAYRTPVILMSATLPPAQREEYIAAYAQGRGDREPAGALPTDVYPRITMYDGGVSDRPIARDEARRAVRVELLADDPVGLVSLLQRLLAEGGCAGVICNTVARAQEAYRALRAEFGDDTVLLHRAVSWHPTGQFGKAIWWPDWGAMASVQNVRWSWAPRYWSNLLMWISTCWSVIWHRLTCCCSGSAGCIGMSDLGDQSQWPNRCSTYGAWRTGMRCHRLRRQGLVQSMERRRCFGLLLSSGAMPKSSCPWTFPGWCGKPMTLHLYRPPAGRNVGSQQERRTLSARPGPRPVPRVIYWRILGNR